MVSYASIKFYWLILIFKGENQFLVAFLCHTIELLSSYCPFDPFDGFNHHSDTTVSESLQWRGGASAIGGGGRVGEGGIS